MPEEFYIYRKEYWVGDSRDGALVSGDGFHYFRMLPEGMILEAFEIYENDEGEEVVNALPEMQNVDWIKDLGFEDMEILDEIEEKEFLRIKNFCRKKERS